MVHEEERFDMTVLYADQDQVIFYPPINVIIGDEWYGRTKSIFVLSATKGSSRVGASTTCNNSLP